MVTQPAPPGSGGKPLPDRVAAEEILHLIVGVAEAGGGLEPLEPEQGTEALLYRSVTLL
jgi:hypothetical protein